MLLFLVWNFNILWYELAIQFCESSINLLSYKAISTTSKNVLYLNGIQHIVIMLFSFYNENIFESIFAHYYVTISLAKYHNQLIVIRKKKKKESSKGYYYLASNKKKVQVRNLGDR